MIIPEQQFHHIARQRRTEAEAAAAAYRLRRDLGGDHPWRLGVGRGLIRLGQWIVPDGPRVTRPVQQVGCYQRPSYA